MKNKITYSLIILFLGNCALTAQDLPTGLKVGIQAGLSYSGLRSVQPEDALSDFDYKSIASYNLNAYIKYQFSQRLGISCEPGFILKGADMENSSSKYRFSYVTMPIMLNFTCTRLFSIGAGIEPDYLTKAEFNSAFYNDFDYTGYCEEFDFGLIAGIDFTIVKFLDIAFRYSFGMLPVMEIQLTDNAGNEVGERKDYNKLAQLSLRFNIIKLKSE